MKLFIDDEEATLLIEILESAINEIDDEMLEPSGRYPLCSKEDLAERMDFIGHIVWKIKRRESPKRKLYDRGV